QHLLANTGGFRRLRRHGAGELLGAEQMPQYAVALLYALRREGFRGIVEILGMGAARQRTEKTAESIRIGRVAFQPLAEGRQQRLDRPLGLLLREVELPRQQVQATSVLRLGKHIEQGQHVGPPDGCKGTVKRFPMRLKGARRKCRLVTERWTRRLGA